MPPGVDRSPVTPAFEANAGPVRLGLIALSTDLTTERDARRILPDHGVALHVTRVAFDNPSTPENLGKILPRLTDAAELLVPGRDLAAICFACTAASVESGDEAVAAAIGRGRPGVPVVTPPLAATRALRHAGHRRIALLTPYLEETTIPMARYFEDAGFDLVSRHCLGVADDRDIAEITLDTILEAAVAADHADAEAMFISCTALRAVDAVERIEDRLGKLVVSSNLAAYWELLRHAGLPARADAPGRLLKSLAGDRAA